MRGRTPKAAAAVARGARGDGGRGRRGEDARGGAGPKRDAGGQLRRR